MSVDIHIKVAKYNRETNLYEKVELFRKVNKGEYPEEEDVNGFRVVPIDAGRDYEMFDGMKHGTYDSGYAIFPLDSINFLSLEPSFAEEIKREMKKEGCYDFYEINLSEFKLYLYEHPMVTDYNANWGEDWEPGDPTPKKENPLKHLFSLIENYLSIADWEYWYNPSIYYKVIFYFDC